jgi:hypothetical protein
MQPSRACESNWPPEAKPGDRRHQNVFSFYRRAAIECDVLSAIPSARFNWLRPQLAPAKRVSRRRPDCNIRSAVVNYAFVHETYPCGLHPLRNHWRLAREGTEARPQTSIHGVPFLLTRMIVVSAGSLHWRWRLRAYLGGTTPLQWSKKAKLRAARIGRPSAAPVLVRNFAWICTDNNCIHITHGVLARFAMPLPMAQIRPARGRTATDKEGRIS